jgi:lysozyme
MKPIALAAVALLAYRYTEAARNGELGELAPEDIALNSIMQLLEGVQSDASELLDNTPPEVAARNVYAFLRTLQAAEGTDKGGRDPYRVVYAYAFEIQDLRDHPGNLGWRGVPLSDAMCRGAGLNPGCVSTAAGAYQIIRGTWNRLAKALRLPDFSPASQDRAAIELIRSRGALADVKAGRFAAAVQKCRREWASLPGAGYGQPERSLQQLAQVFNANGGAIT